MKWIARFGAVVLLSALILAPRMTQMREVFVEGGVYFTDADCYARMTRVRLCAAQPGLVVRHHDFENFPTGTTPHTTAPLDYLILGLAQLLRPFTTQWLDVAGALISPLLALAGGWFLWWWALRFRVRERWVMLVVYAISPILAHGTEVGRPDHQALLLALLTLAVAAEVTLIDRESLVWSATSGGAWGLALWVSLYEPLLLLGLIALFSAIRNRMFFARKDRRIGWMVAAEIGMVAFAIERRWPEVPLHDAELQRWWRPIGELASVSWRDPIWFRWSGWLLLALPWLMWRAVRQPNEQSRGAVELFALLMVGTALLTVWQARWGYFFALSVAMALPVALSGIGRLGHSRATGAIIWTALLLSLWPMLREWDERLWPNEQQQTRREVRRRDNIALHSLAESMRSADLQPFLAPWWLSPAIAYWSGQPGVAGSSHESLAGNLASARFYIASENAEAREILAERKVKFVFATDATEVISNSSEMLGIVPTQDALAWRLDHAPSRAPAFLQLFEQAGGEKLYIVK